MKKQRKWWEDEEKYLGESYDWHEPITQGVFSDRRTKEENKQAETQWWEKEWSGYEKTGVWKGYNYYRQPTLDYKYVEQMANALSAKYNIDVRTGSGWSSDVKKKILIYDPLSLITGTKAQLINSLVHELGHINYTTPLEEIQVGQMYAKYKDRGAKGVVNLFEDFRIDKLVERDFIRDYGELTATDILSENVESVKELASVYQQNSDRIKQLNIEYAERMAERPDMLTNPELVKTLFGGSAKNQKEILEKLKKIKEKILNKETLHDYSTSMILDFYGEYYEATPKLQEYIDKTRSFVKQGAKEKSFQGLMNIVEKALPILKPLFDDLQEGFGELREAFSGGEVAKRAMEEALAQIRYESKNQNRDNDPIEDIRNGQEEKRRSGAGNVIPQGWYEGDYTSLKDSVATPIKELVRKLTFLKRTEETKRYTPRQKSGKIVIKGLYRHRLGDRKLFKRQVEAQQVITSFAFSVMVDISGSMTGDPLVHSVRGMIMLAEVFDKLEIPFEVVTFGNQGKIVKSFKDTIKSKQSKLGGLVLHTQGSTNLYDALLNATDIAKRWERNRIVVILSDGGVGSYKSADFYENHFKDWQKKGIKTIGIGLRCGDEVKTLCLGIGEAIDDVGTMPDIFSRILKEEIENRMKGRRI